MDLYSHSNGNDANGNLSDTLKTFTVGTVAVALGVFWSDWFQIVMRSVVPGRGILLRFLLGAAVSIGLVTGAWFILHKDPEPTR